MPKTIVAMSGGLDSAVAAAMLLERGHDVEGLTMRIWHEDTSCGALDAEVSSAARICEQLGIRHQVVDLSQAFKSHVVEPFVEAYAEGRTPNPCVLCNPTIKFGLLLEHAHALGAYKMATGHYARILCRSGRLQLWRGVDRSKDQSYFLYRLGQAELEASLFPLGNWTKVAVREYARSLALHVAERPESQDICFIRDGDYRRFLREHRPDALEPGPIYDTQGTLLGQHHGLADYTVGQRRGLGIAAPRPLYVLRLDSERNALVVGYQESLGYDTLETEATVCVAGCPPQGTDALKVQIRYRAEPMDASVTWLPCGRARVVLSHTLRDVTPGQSAVFYRDDQVVGGGIISQVYDRE